MKLQKKNYQPTNCILCLMFSFLDPESAHENDNESVPVEFGRVGFVAWCALYAVHTYRRPPQGLRFR